MLLRRQVAIDFLPDSPFRYQDWDAVVCLDVMHATTTLITAAALGRSSFPVASLDAARRVAAALEDPLIADGRAEAPPAAHGDYDLGGSPAWLVRRTDSWRPLVLVSSAGGALVANSAGCAVSYVACLRNLTATADALARYHRRVALLGAGNAGKPCVEDQAATAWLAERLIARGFSAASSATADLVGRWRGASPRLLALGRSAERLRRAGREDDLDFVLNHVDDLALSCRFEDGRIAGAHASGEASDSLRSA